jgi:hypothetical protein
MEVQKTTTGLMSPLYVVPHAILLMSTCVASVLGLLSPVAIGGVVIASLLVARAQLWQSSQANRKRPPVERVEREALAMQRLAAIEDVGVVAPLIDALHWLGGSASCPEIWQALGRLLARLTAEQARELGSARHGILAFWIYGWALRAGHDHFVEIGREPLLGTLHVLAHLGQTSFHVVTPGGETEISVLSVLSKWAEGETLEPDPVVQQAAAACSDAILQKIALSRAGQHLLRASAPASSSPETLLRSVESAGQTPPQELLRPGNPQTGSESSRSDSL